MPHEMPAKEISALPLMHPGRPVGRDEELKTVYAHLRANRAVLLTGPAGSGKTTLAAALSSAYTQQAGGVLWLNLKNAPLAEILVRIGRAYGLADVTGSENPVAMLGAVAGALLQNRPLLVLDGQHDGGALNQFINRAAENLPVLILSETPLEGPWEQVALGPLGDTDAALLFKQRAGLAGGEHDIEVYGIIKLLDYQPYPIVITARAMAASKQTPGEYLPALQQIASKAGGDGLVTALTASYRTLNSALQGLLLIMGATFRGEASAELLSMASGAPAESVNQALTVLSQLYLVEKFERYSEPYYRVHDRVYQFAQAWLRGSNRLEGLQEKFRDAVLAYTRKHSTGVRNKLAAEMDTLVAAAQWATANGDRDTANQLVIALTQAGDFIKSRGYVYELLQIRSASSGSTSAFPAYGDLVLEEDELEEDFEDYAEDFEEADELDEEDFEEDFEQEDELDGEAAGEEETLPPLPEDAGALQSINIEQLRAALAQARQQKNLLRQAQILKAIGRVLVSQRKDGEAIATYNELTTAYEELEDNEGLLEALQTLCELLVRTDNAQAAIMHATAALRIAEELDDEQARLNLLMTLGDARQNLGESGAAARDYTAALRIAREMEDPALEAMALYRLGYAQLDDGEALTAIETWEKALSSFRSQSARDYEGRVMGGLGQAHGELGRWSEAIQFHRSAMYIAREVRDREEEALQLSSLARAQLEANQLPAALISYRQALHLAYESGDRDNIVSAAVDLVRLMLESRRLLDICELIVDDALGLEPGDKDLHQLKERITRDRALAQADGVQQAPVNGTARDYAANAYAMLEG